MPNRVPAVRYTAARRSSMRTLSSSDGVSWRTLMGYPSYARNRACALPSPSPFHYVMAKIMPVVQLATHARSSTLYGHTVVRSYGRTVIRSYGRTVIRSYGRTTKFFCLDGLLLFRIVMGLRSASSAIRFIVYKCKMEGQNLNFTGVQSYRKFHYWHAIIPIRENS